MPRANLSPVTLCPSCLECIVQIITGTSAGTGGTHQGGRGQVQGVQEEDDSSSGSLEHPGMAAPRRQRAFGARPAAPRIADLTKDRYRSMLSLAEIHHVVECYNAEVFLPCLLNTHTQTHSDRSRKRPISVTYTSCSIRPNLSARRHQCSVSTRATCVVCLCHRFFWYAGSHLVQQTGSSQVMTIVCSMVWTPSSSLAMKPWGAMCMCSNQMLVPGTMHTSSSAALGRVC